MHTTRAARRGLSHSLSFAELVLVAAISAVLLVAIAAMSVMVIATVFGPAMLSAFDPLRGR